MNRNYQFFVVLLIVFAAGPALAGPSDLLVGRWRSDTAPTGYWIIDRFADGRFAEKQYFVLDCDPSKGVEIVVVWGRWKLRGKRYSKTLAGSTSAFFQKFVGKRLVYKVAQVSRDHFAFESHDGATRDEQRQGSEQPLLSVETNKPADAEARRIIDTVTPALHAIPAWVREAKAPTGPSEALQRTGHGG